MKLPAWISNRRTIVAVFALVWVISRAGILSSIDPDESDVELYFRYAVQGVDEHQVPYRDFDVEYPPAAYWFIARAALDRPQPRAGRHVRPAAEGIGCFSSLRVSVRGSGRGLRLAGLRAAAGDRPATLAGAFRVAGRRISGRDHVSVPGHVRAAGYRTHRAIDDLGLVLAEGRGRDGIGESQPRPFVRGAGAQHQLQAGAAAHDSVSAVGRIARPAPPAKYSSGTPGAGSHDRAAVCRSRRQRRRRRGQDVHVSQSARHPDRIALRLAHGAACGAAGTRKVVRIVECRHSLDARAQDLLDVPAVGISGRARAVELVARRAIHARSCAWARRVWRYADRSFWPKCSRRNTLFGRCRWHSC